ncbi:MAG: PIN-like domain-containing protein [Hespellia sp.]|nr:PIN-like domain-containing protein [Hespellia sp.]
MFDKIWNNGLVSFDTCSLGRMYEWESKYAVNIKDALSYLLTIGKLWETQINVQEFSNERIAIREAIYEQKYIRGIFNNLKKRPIPWNKIDGTLGRWEEKGFLKQFREEIEKIHGQKNVTEAEYNCIVEKSKYSSYEIDLEALFDKILRTDEVILTEEEKQKLKLRYDTGEMCPGAEDSKKNNGNKYNDLYIWKLLQKKSKLEQKDIIFVTADTAKGDWFIDKEPRPEYLQEFREETGQEILILTLSDFWKHCENYLDNQVDQFIEISSIKDQIEEKYNVFYQEDICDKINELLAESDVIQELLEDDVDCCVDMPVFDELIETTIDSIDIEEYDDENVYVTVYLQTEAGFEAMNHTSGEDWSAGNSSVVLAITVSAEIPVVWTSEDTERRVLEDEIIVNEITDIEVLRTTNNENDHDEYAEDDSEYDEDYEEMEYIEGDELF